MVKNIKIIIAVRKLYGAFCQDTEMLSISFNL